MCLMCLNEVRMWCLVHFSWMLVMLMLKIKQPVHNIPRVYVMQVEKSQTLFRGNVDILYFCQRRQNKCLIKNVV